MYKEIYYHTYCEDFTGRECKVSILRRDYTGSAIPVDSLPTPFVKGIIAGDYPLLGGVYPTKASISIVSQGEVRLEDLYTDSDTEFMVEHYIEGALDWRGYVSPDGLSETVDGGISVYNLDCFDGLTLLKQTPFLDENGENYGNRAVYDYSFKDLISVLLAKTGLDLGMLTLVDRVATSDMPGEFKRMNLYDMGDGWIEGEPLVDGAFTNLIVGHYFVYRIMGQSGAKISKIVAVDTSQVPTNASMKLDPPVLRSMGFADLEGAFMAGAHSTTEDILATTVVDTRLWVDNSDNENRTRDKESEVEEKPYWAYPEKAMKCWDILDAIALAWDVRIYQQKGIWMVEALDAHRLPDSFYEYDSEGEYLGRVLQQEPASIPACADEARFFENGYKRFFQNAMKSVSVQYKYRYKTKFDEQINRILNGRFLSPSASAPPETFTPSDWFRNPAGAGIVYNLSRPAAPIYLQVDTPNNTFNKNSWLKSTPVRVFKGDIVLLSFEHSMMESYNSTNAPNLFGRFGIYRVMLTSTTGDTYFLVNSGDAEDWRDIYFQSGNLKARWEKSSADDPYHLLINHSTGHATNSGEYSEMSEVKITPDGAPVSGTVEFLIVGEGSRLFDPNNTRGKEVKGYVPSMVAPDPEDEDQSVRYTENVTDTTYAPVVWMRQATSEPPHALHVTNVQLSFVASEEERGSGRLYEYVQDKDVKEALPPVEILFGDESNPDVMSSIFTDGNVRVLWFSRDGSIQPGTFGLVLARAIARRYYVPGQRIDGSVSMPDMELGKELRILERGDLTMRLLSGDIDNNDSSLRGTLYELYKGGLPDGGYDYGPGSISKR